ncbi:MAG: hypothetical protein WBA51_10930, partial [Erythrobacter sp.]
ILLTDLVKKTTRHRSAAATAAGQNPLKAEAGAAAPEPFHAAYLIRPLSLVSCCTPFDFIAHIFGDHVWIVHFTRPDFAQGCSLFGGTLRLIFVGGRGR